MNEWKLLILEFSYLFPTYFIQNYYFFTTLEHWKSSGVWTLPHLGTSFPLFHEQPQVSTLSSSYRVGSWQCCRGGGLSKHIPKYSPCYRYSRQRDQQCNALWYLDNEHLQICKADIAAKSLIYFKTIFYTAFYIDILTYLKNLTPKWNSCIYRKRPATFLLHSVHWLRIQAIHWSWQ